MRSLSRRIVRDDRDGVGLAQEEPKAVAVLAGQTEGAERGEDRRVVRVLSRWRAAGPGRRQQRGSWLCARRASARSPVAPPPFSARRRAMSFCCGAVDHVNVIRTCCCQGAKQLLPEAACRPSMKAVVDRCWRTVAGGTILQAPTKLQ